MPPKRKDVESKDKDQERQKPIYVSEVSWFKVHTHAATTQISDDEATDGGNNAGALIHLACKLTYIQYHDIQDRDSLSSLLETFGDGDAVTEAELTRTLKHAQSTWKSHIVNKFLLPHVKEIVRKWSVAHPYADFAALSPPERTRLWLEAYDADPKGTVTAMWKPIIKVLDLTSILRTDLSEGDNAKMKAMRKMLRKKYYFGCECTYKNSVGGKPQKAKILDHWASYAKFEDYASSVVSFADMPLSSAALSLISADRPSKKRKVTAMEDDFETLTPSSMQDVSDTISTDPGTTGPVADEQQEARESSNTPRASSSPHFVSETAPATRVALDQESPTDLPTDIQDLPELRASPVAPTVSADAEEKDPMLRPPAILTPTNANSPSIAGPISKEARNIRKLFGIDDQGLVRTEEQSAVAVASSSTALAPVEDGDLF